MIYFSILTIHDCPSMRVTRYWRCDSEGYDCTWTRSVTTIRHKDRGMSQSESANVSGRLIKWRSSSH